VKLKQSAFIFILFSAFAFSAFAQTAQPTPPVEDDGEVIKVESRLVIVPVSVLDASGQPILNLKAQDFRVAEDNKTQQIEQVSDAEKVPLEIAILFDISASTDALFKFEQQTAAKFLQEVMRPEDRAAIFTIGARPVLVQPRDVADKSAQAIQAIQPTKQFTAFYDSVSAAAEYLQANAPVKSRKVIIVISDGEDTNSIGLKKGFNDVFTSLGKQINTITGEKLRMMLDTKRGEIRTTEQNKVLRSLQNADTVFYSVNPAGNSFQLNKISVNGQNNLQKFADQTGGTAFLPKFQSTTLKDNLQNSQNIKVNEEILVKIFRQLANELRAQYLLQYYSEADFPTNKYVKLGVSLQNPQGWRVRARQGYFVKN